MCIELKPSSRFNYFYFCIINRAFIYVTHHQYINIFIFLFITNSDVFMIIIYIFGLFGSLLRCILKINFLGDRFVIIWNHQVTRTDTVYTDFLRFLKLVWLYILPAHNSVYKKCQTIQEVFKQLLKCKVLTTFRNCRILCQIT